MEAIRLEKLPLAGAATVGCTPLLGAVIADRFSPRQDIAKKRVAENMMQPDVEQDSRNRQWSNQDQSGFWTCNSPRSTIVR